MTTEPTQADIIAAQKIILDALNPGERIGLELEEKFCPRPSTKESTFSKFLITCRFPEIDAWNASCSIPDKQVQSEYRFDNFSMLKPYKDIFVKAGAKEDDYRCEIVTTTAINVDGNRVSNWQISVKTSVLWKAIKQLKGQVREPS
jgi:hypothetical protein